MKKKNYTRPQNKDKIEVRSEEKYEKQRLSNKGTSENNIFKSNHDDQYFG